MVWVVEKSIYTQCPNIGCSMSNTLEYFLKGTPIPIRFPQK